MKINHFKTKLIPQLLLSLLLLSIQFVQAQCPGSNYIVTYNMPSDLNVCDPMQTFTINVANTSGTDCVGLLTIDLSKTDGFRYVASSVSDVGGLIVENDISDLSQPIFDLPITNGQSISIDFQVDIQCATLGGNLEKQIEVKIDCDADGTIEETCPSTTFGVTSPVINFLSFTNENVTGLNFDDNFSRSIIICNNGLGDLGSFNYTSTSENGLILDEITVNGTSTPFGTPSGSITITNADILAIGGPVSGGVIVPDGENTLGFNECIQITESYTASGCLKLPTTHMATWGCFSEVCETVEGYTSASTIAPPDPIIGFTLNENYTSCPSSGISRTFTVDNTAPSDATSVCFEVRADRPGQNALDFDSFTIDGALIDGTNATITVEEGNQAGGCGVGGSTPVTKVEICIPTVANMASMTIGFDQYGCCESGCNTVNEHQGASVQNASFENICGTNIRTSGDSWENVRLDYGQIPPDLPVELTTCGTACYSIYQWEDNWINQDVDIATCDGCAIEMNFEISQGLDATYSDPFNWTDENGIIWAGTPVINTSPLGVETLTITFTAPMPLGFQPEGSQVCVDVCPDCTEASTCCGINPVVITNQVNFLPNDCGGCVVPLECKDVAGGTATIRCNTCCGPCEGIQWEVSGQRHNYGCLDALCGEPMYNRIVAGDTLETVFTGIIVDNNGAPAPTFSNAYIDMDLTSTNVSITDMEYIEAEVNITEALTGTTYSCTLPISPTATHIDLSVANLISQSCLPAGFPDYTVDDEFEVKVYTRFLKDINNAVISLNVTNRLWVYNGAYGNPANNCGPPFQYTRFLMAGSVSETGQLSNSKQVDGCELVQFSYQLKQHLTGSPYFDFFRCENRQLHYPVSEQVLIPNGYDFEKIDIELRTSNGTGSGYNSIKHSDLDASDANLVLNASTLDIDVQNIFGITPSNCGIDEAYVLVLTLYLSVDCVTPETKQCGEVFPVQGFDGVFSDGTSNPASYIEVEDDDSEVFCIEYFPPEYEMTSLEINPTLIDPAGFNFDWDMELVNKSRYSEASNLFFYVLKKPADVSIDGFYADCDNEGTLLTPINDLYHLPPLGTNGSTPICISGSYADCSRLDPDTIQIAVGYTCNDAPTMITDFTDLCEAQILNFTFKRPVYDIQIADVSASNVTDLCSDQDYRVQLSNGKLGFLFGMDMELTIPPNISVLPATFSLEWDGNTYAIPSAAVVQDPLDPYQYTITDLNQYVTEFGTDFVGGFPGVSELENGYNQMFLNFQVRTECDFVVGSVIDFNISANNICGDFADSHFDAGEGLLIDGITLPNEVDVTIDDISFNPCSGEEESLTVAIEGDDADFDAIQITIPSSITYQSYTNISNTSTPTTSTLPDGSTVFNIEATGDDASFSINLTANPGLDCGETGLGVKIQPYINASSSCPGASGGTCSVVLPSATVVSAVSIDRYELGLANFNISGCAPDPLTGTLELVNEGSSTVLASSTYNSFNLELFEDVNYDGIIDGGDNLIGSQLVTIAVDIPSGGTLSIPVNYAASACAMIGRVDVQGGCGFICEPLIVPFRNVDPVDISTTDTPGICYDPCNGTGDSFDLATLNIIYNGNATANTPITYYANFADAQAGTPQLASTIVSPTSTSTYYLKVGDDKGCVDIEPVDIFVATCGTSCANYAAPSVQDIFICPATYKNAGVTNICPTGGGFPLSGDEETLVYADRYKKFLPDCPVVDIPSGTYWSAECATRGSGSTAVGNEFRFRANNVNEATFQEVFDTEDYLEFTYNSGPGYVLDITSFSTKHRMPGDLTNAQMAVYVSINGGNFSLLQTIIPNGSYADNPLEIPLSIAGACTISFRIYAWGAETEFRQFGVDDIHILGTAKPGLCGLGYNFYADDNGTLGIPLASKTACFDPLVDLEDASGDIIPGVYSYWVTTIDPTFCCESDPRKVTINVVTCCDSPEGTDALLEACDDGDGTVDFDLNAATTTVDTDGDGDGDDSDGDKGYAVTYHTSLADANAFDPNTQLPAPINPVGYAASNGTLIYARINNPTDNCYAIASVALRVYTPASANHTIDVCDDGDGDGNVALDLNAYADMSDPNGDGDGDNTDGDVGYTVSFHNSLADASSATLGGDNPLASPYTISDGEVIHTRVEILGSGACIANGQLTFNVNGPVVANHELIICPTDSDFDLTLANTVVDDQGDGDGSTLDGDAGNLTEGYYATAADAIAGDGADTNFDSTPDVFKLVSPYVATDGTIVYARVEDMGGCIAVAEVTLSIDASPVANTAAMASCDDGDGTIAFDIKTLRSTIDADGDGDADDSDGDNGFHVTFHPNLAAAQAGTGILPEPYNSSGETIYARVTNNNGCYETAEVTLTVTPSPTTMPASLSECAGIDGMASFVLTDLDATVDVAGSNTVTYHSSIANADLGMSALSSPYTSGTSTLYARVDDGSCYRLAVVSLTVSTGPPCPTFPIELVDFYGLKKEQSNELTWITATEINASHFIVERSQSGLAFRAISDKIEATGNSTQGQTYVYLDQDVPPQSFYYRIKMVDHDGYTEYSKVIWIKRTSNAIKDILAYPNPTLDRISIQFEDGFIPEGEYMLYDQLGRVIIRNQTTQDKDSDILELDLSSLAAGTYFFVMVNDRVFFKHTIVKVGP